LHMILSDLYVKPARIVNDVHSQKYSD